MRDTTIDYGHYLTDAELQDLLLSLRGPGGGMRRAFNHAVVIATQRLNVAIGASDAAPAPEKVPENAGQYQAESATRDSTAPLSGSLPVDILFAPDGRIAGVELDYGGRPYACQVRNIHSRGADLCAYSYRLPGDARFTRCSMPKGHQGKHASPSTPRTGGIDRCNSMRMGVGVNGDILFWCHLPQGHDDSHEAHVAEWR